VYRRKQDRNPTDSNKEVLMGLGDKIQEGVGKAKEAVRDALKK